MYECTRCNAGFRLATPRMWGEDKSKADFALQQMPGLLLRNKVSNIYAATSCTPSRSIQHANAAGCAA